MVLGGLVHLARSRIVGFLRFLVKVLRMSNTEKGPFEYIAGVIKACIKPYHFHGVSVLFSKKIRWSLSRGSLD